MADPVIAWAGGKRHMLDDILIRLPDNAYFRQYHEPFVGGGAVFFAIEPKEAFLNDINPRLINFYQKLKSDGEEIIQMNKELDDEILNENREVQVEIYKSYRDEFNQIRVQTKSNGESRLKPNSELDEQEILWEAVLFLFFNRAGWNSLFRTNKKGEFNVPMGTKITYTSGIEDKVREGRDVLLNAKLTSADFREVLGHVEKDDLVFLDPPYPPKSDTSSFQGYHKEKFDLEQQKELRDLMIELDEIGAHLLLTNAVTEATEEIFNIDKFPGKWSSKRISGERRINEKAGKRTNIGKTDMIIWNTDVFKVTEPSQHVLADYI